MRANPIASTIACFALAVCLTTGFGLPAAYADDAAESQSLTGGTATVEAMATATAKATTEAATTKTTPKPKAVTSVSAAFKNGDTRIQWLEGAKDPSKYVYLSWKAPKSVKGLKSQTYTLRYSEDSNLAYQVKTKTTAGTSIRLPLGDVYVQIRTNAKYGKKTVHSKWASYRLGYWDAHGSTFEDGTWTEHTTRFLELKDLDNKKVGRYEATITACTPRSLKLGNAQLTSAKTGTIDVSWKQPKSDPNGYYRVRYAYNKQMKNARVIEGISDTSATIEGLKKGKRVYVQVCTCDRTYNPLTGEWLDGYRATSRMTAAKSIVMPRKMTAQKPATAGAAGAA